MVSLAVSNLTVSYPECTEKVLHNISFEIETGEFAVLCGATGCGKTTLLRMLKKELTPLCNKSGTILFEGQDIDTLSPYDSAAGIGFVMQHPEQQIVTDKVWHELAFGLENLGINQQTMERKIAETASYFGMEEWLDKDPAMLSGGQKQILNLASVMIMQPRLILLDEPTAQLDPIAATDFLTTLTRLNRDFSTTILIAEHRLEDVIPLCTKLLVFTGNTIDHIGTPEDVLAELPKSHPAMYGMPAAVRLYHALGEEGDCPLSVNAARSKLIPQYCHKIKSLPPKQPFRIRNIALEIKNGFFRYERKGRDVLNGLNLNVPAGSLYCLIGGNGAGKSTVLSIVCGLHRLYSGKVRIFGKNLEDYKHRSLHQNCVTMLPQDVQTVFLMNTAAEELSEIDKDFVSHLRDFPFDLHSILHQHPYDLSGGQQQILALAKVMLTNPRLLLLDEPTKGLDALSKLQLAKVLKGLKEQQITIFCVTHDLEFAAEHADFLAFLSQGRLISADIPEEIFSDHAFYTTAASRISRGFYDRAVTLSEVSELCLLNGKSTQV